MNIQGGMGQIPVNVGGGAMPGNMGQSMQGGVGMSGPMGGLMPGANVMGGMSSAGGMNVPGNMMQNPGPSGQMQGPIPQQQSQEKLDNISKVKSLMHPLRETLTQTLKTAAQALHQNHLIDAGTIKGVDNVVPRFDKNLEEFYSICDQIELHLKTAQECIQQGSSSGRYLPQQVTPTRTEPMATQDGNTLTYPQYLNTVRSQIAYAKEIHDSLSAQPQNIAPPE